LKPVTWFNTGVRVGWTDVSIGSGTDDRYPSTEELFTPVTAPGLNDETSFLVTDLFATVDTRDQPGNPRAGGYYGVLWRRLSDRDVDRYSFDSVDVDLQQFIPVFDKKRVFATRVRLTSTDAADGDEVPFYFRPTLGGHRSLRSEDEYRFRDLKVFWTNIEYRWEAFSGLDMALFTDLGGVASEFDQLKPFDKKAYGIGLRFNTYKAVFVRFDVAGGGDSGIHYHFKFSGVF
jgi:outer membrane translocation and assembly module TamA